MHLRQYHRWLLATSVWIYCTGLFPDGFCVPAQGTGLVIDLQGIDLDVLPSKYPERKVEYLTEITWQVQDISAVEVFDYTPVNNGDHEIVNKDTDDEASVGGAVAGKRTKAIDKLPAAKQIKHNRSRHAPSSGSSDYDFKNNYIKEEKSMDGLRYQLSSDALDVVESEPNARSRESTVCLCVALRDHHAHIKKFAFHNQGSVMSPPMREKATALGYDVIQTEQVHAEMQFLKFLILRDQLRPGLYTHVVGMGCSRCYCAECNHALRGVLAGNYAEVATAVERKKEENRLKLITRSPISRAVSDSNTSGLYRQTVEQVTEYKVVKGDQIVDSSSYENFYLPTKLQNLFNDISTSPSNLSFEERFNKKDTPTSVGNTAYKKRRARPKIN